MAYVPEESRVLSMINTLALDFSQIPRIADDGTTIIVTAMPFGTFTQIERYILAHTRGCTDLWNPREYQWLSATEKGLRAVHALNHLEVVRLDPTLYRHTSYPERLFFLPPSPTRASTPVPDSPRYSPRTLAEDDAIVAAAATSPEPVPVPFRSPRPVRSPEAIAARRAAIQQALDEAIAESLTNPHSPAPEAEDLVEVPPAFPDVDLGPNPTPRATPPSSPSPISYHTASSEPVNPHPAPNFAALSDDDLEHMLLKLGYDPDPTLPERLGGTAYHHYAHAQNPGRLRREQEVDESLQPLLTSPSAEQCIRLSRALTSLKDQGVRQDVARYQAWYRCTDRLRRFRDELTRILHERELEFILIANRLDNADTI